MSKQLSLSLPLLLYITELISNTGYEIKFLLLVSAESLSSLGFESGWDQKGTFYDPLKLFFKQGRIRQQKEEAED